MKKIFHTNLDSVNPIDGTIRARYIPALGVSSLIESDIVIIWLTWQKGFEFDQDLFDRIHKSGKKVVVADFTEFGWEMDSAPYYGFIDSVFEEKFSKEQLKLNSIKELSVALYFKRELFEGEEIPEIYQDKVYPIDYMASESDMDFGIEPFKKFKEREVKLFNFWGLSNPERVNVHSLLIQLLNHGYNVCDNMDYLQKEVYDIVSLYRPHHSRLNMDVIFTIQKNSKLTLSMPGCGKKCFRSSEASKNSIMVHCEPKMIWAFPWDEQNSIIIPKQPTLEDIKSLFGKSDKELYSIYVNGVNNHRNYLPETYMNYIWQKLEQVH